MKKIATLSLLAALSLPVTFAATQAGHAEKSKASTSEEKAPAKKGKKKGHKEAPPATSKPSN